MELNVGEILHGHYKIVSVLFRERDSITYLVSREKTEYFCQDTGAAEKSVGPGYHMAIEAVKSFRHPNLVRVVDNFRDAGREYIILEHVKGRTLEALVSGTSRLGNRKVFELGAQLCEALGYCNGRGSPFIFADINPQHVIVTDDGVLMLMDYQLHRCFQEGGVVLGRTAEHRATNFAVLADMLGYLVLRRRGKVDTHRVTSLNPSLGAVVERCVTALSIPGYSFREVRRALDQSLPLEAPLAVAPPPAVPVAQRTRPSFWVGLGALAVVGFQFWNTLVTPRLATPESLAYVGLGHSSVVALDTHTGQSVHYLEFSPSGVNDLRLLFDGTVLLAADAVSSQIKVMNLQTRVELHPIGVMGHPTHLLSNPDGSLLYSFSQSPPCMCELSTHPLELRRWCDLPVSPDFVTTVMNGQYLLFGTSNTNGVHVMDLRNYSVSADVLPTGPAGPMAISPDNRELWVANAGAGHITIVSLDGVAHGKPAQCRVLGSVTGTDGQFVSLMFTPDGDRVLCLDRDNDRVVVMDRVDRRVSTTFPTKGTRPVSWGWISMTPPSLWILHQDSKSITRLELKSLQVDNVASLMGKPGVLEIAGAEK